MNGYLRKVEQKIVPPTDLKPQSRQRGTLYDLGSHEVESEPESKKLNLNNTRLQGRVPATAHLFCFCPPSQHQTES